MAHLLGGEVLEAQEDHGEVRGLEGLEAWHVVVAGGDFTAGLVNVEQDRALEAVVTGQQAGNGRQALLAAVFVIACHEDDVLALAQA